VNVGFEKWRVSFDAFHVGQRFLLEFALLVLDECLGQIDDRLELPDRPGIRL